mgnify:CR=1 FL=1|tara:strand:+ start:60 stop:797 length:738 start_codon:yes stop_codon:yes gene_type:complete
MGKARGIHARLGYNIKYIDPLPGNKLKRAMYEIKPGHWVTRAQVPEHKAKHWHYNNKWNNRQYGFIMNLYSSAVRESKTGRRGVKVIFKFTKETWWEHWLKQKKKYGMYCPYSKVLMTTKRGQGRGTHGGKRVDTNISKDQIWPGRGYTPMNLIFCSVKFNDNKRSITPDGCEAVIDIHRERMDEWAKEIVLKKEMRKVDIAPFFGKELKKLKKSLSPVEYKRFIELSYDKARLERRREGQNARP